MEKSKIVVENLYGWVTENMGDLTVDTMGLANGIYKGVRCIVVPVSLRRFNVFPLLSGDDIGEGVNKPLVIDLESTKAFRKTR